MDSFELVNVLLYALITFFIKVIPVSTFKNTSSSLILKNFAICLIHIFLNYSSFLLSQYFVKSIFLHIYFLPIMGNYH